MALHHTLDFILNHPLNRRNKIKAVLRFLKWQIGSRLVPGKVICNWINGSKFIAGLGDTGLTGNIYCGLHEFNDMGFILHSVNKQDLFVDIGANIGSYTILACGAMGARGIAFEPIPSTFKKLIENILINNLMKSVECANIGIGDKEGNLEFTSDLDATNHIVAENERHGNTIEIEVRTLDMALNGRTPAVVKIDVEGYETLVLKGSEETLENKDLLAVIIELNGSGDRYGFDEALIHKKMMDYGFRSYRYDPFKRKLTSLSNKNMESDNTLYSMIKFFMSGHL